MGQDEGGGITLPLSPSNTSAQLNKKDVEPPVEGDLLDHLSQKFPDVLPSAFSSAEDLAFLIGQQSVIRHLRALNISQKDPNY